MEEDTEERVRALVARATAGDREAVATLYRYFEPNLIAAVHRRRGATLRGLMESVDLVQSTWAEVLDDLPDFEDRGPGSFEAWLSTCLLNKIRAKGRFHAAQRRDAGRLVRPGDADDSSSPDPAPRDDLTPSRVVSGREEVQRLTSILRGLPDLQREVLILRLGQGLPYAAIAERVGKSVDATKKTYARGLARLVGELGPG